MCQFNFILTEKPKDKQKLAQTIKYAGFGFREVNNKHLTNQIENFQYAILTTKNHCDCGSIIGMDEFISPREIDVDKERKKLKKKKWSDSKIERYLNDKIKSQNKADENKDIGNKAEEDRWIKLIDNLINENINFGIFHHQFDGLIEEEKVELSKVKTIKKTELEIRHLRNMVDCELIRIKK